MQVKEFYKRETPKRLLVRIKEDILAMPRKKEELIESATFRISLPKTRKTKRNERRKLFKKMKSLVERDKELLLIKDMSFEKNVISLDAEEFSSLISFDKPISVQIGVSRDIEKNKNRVNDLANKLANYIKTILGESAKEARVYATLITPRRKGVNLAKKFIEERRLVKINELTKKTLSPKGIMFEYKSNEHENTVMNLYDEKLTVLLVMSRYEYKDIIPWDFIIEEYNNLKESIEIVGKLAQEEF